MLKATPIGAPDQTVALGSLDFVDDLALSGDRVYFLDGGAVGWFSSDGSECALTTGSVSFTGIDWAIHDQFLYMTVGSFEQEEVWRIPR